MKDNSAMAKCATRVARIWKNSDDGSAQCVFHESDESSLKDMIESAGVPSSRIFTAEDESIPIDGQSVVIISTEGISCLSAGLRDRMVAIHHLDSDWIPGAIAH